MIIGIDGNEANQKERVGVNKYAYELLWGLFRLNERSGKHKLIVYLKNRPLDDLPRPTDNLKYKVLSGKGFWIIAKLTPYIFLNPDRLDCFFSPSHYTLPLARVPRVCSIMDLGYLEYSEQFKKVTFWQLKYWTAISVFVSKQILTISEASKKDIVRHYPFASRKITVTLPGYDRKIFNNKIDKDLVRQVKNKYSIVGDYFLYLGTIKPSKNIEGLIKAFKSVSAKYNDITLVIAGKKGWMYDAVYKEAVKLGLSDKVVFTDFVSEKDKAPLICGSKAFVLPSFWEGFGLDVVSAMASGVLVVVSNAGSLPEVAGDAAIYIDPKNIDSISKGLEKVLAMTQKDYNKKVEQGFAQAGKFSWEEAAGKTMEAIEKC